MEKPTSVPDRTPHQQRRGAQRPNPIKSGVLQIRLVFPPEYSGDIEEQPAKNMRYVLKVGGQEFKGTTDEKGLTERHDVPFGVGGGVLHLLHGDQTKSAKGSSFWTVFLKIGHLHLGLDYPRGALARLNNLGLYAGIESDTMDPRAVRAVRRFQARFMASERLEELDVPKTFKKLKEVHGG